MESASAETPAHLVIKKEFFTARRLACAAIAEWWKKRRSLGMSSLTNEDQARPAGTIVQTLIEGFKDDKDEPSELNVCRVLNDMDLNKLRTFAKEFVHDPTGTREMWMVELDEECTHHHSHGFKTERAALCGAIACWLNRLNVEEQTNIATGREVVAGSTLSTSMPTRSPSSSPVMKLVWKLVRSEEDGTYSPAKAAAVDVKAVMATMANISDYDLYCFSCYLCGSDWTVRVNGAIVHDF